MELAFLHLATSFQGILSHFRAAVSKVKSDVKNMLNEQRIAIRPWIKDDNMI